MSLASPPTIPKFIYEALDMYGISDAKVSKPQKGYRNSSYALTTSDNQMVNLIVYKSEPGILLKIRNAKYTSTILNANSLPVRRQIDERILRLRTSTDYQYVALYNYLPGHTIPWEAYTQNHLKVMGLGLARAHAAWEGRAAEELPDVIADCRDLTDRMQSYFAKPGVSQAMTEYLKVTPSLSLWNSFDSLLRDSNFSSVRQPLHMDFVRGNVLFDTQDNTSSELQVGKVCISGILDFEKSAFGPAVFDVARTLSFLLIDSKHKNAGEVRKYFLYSGYKKRGNMPLAQFAKDSTLESLTDFFMMHDFYKFLLHNPYESLNQNQHYLRTRTALVEKGKLLSL